MKASCSLGLRKVWVNAFRIRFGMIATVHSILTRLMTCLPCLALNRFGSIGGSICYQTNRKDRGLMACLARLMRAFHLPVRNELSTKNWRTKIFCIGLIAKTTKWLLIAPLVRTAETRLPATVLPDQVVTAHAAEKQPRPNLLFVIADQWRAQAFGFAGDPNVQTCNRISVPRA